MGDFTRSIEEFVGASPWLGPQDAPALASLKAMASALDNEGMTPALLSQFGLAYRSLLKRAPSEHPADELEELLAGGGVSDMGVATTPEARARQLFNLRPKPTIDLTGQRFGRLVVTGDTGERRGVQPVWSWACDCGTVGTSQGRHLRAGSARSCGCVRREMAAAKGREKRGLDVVAAPRYTSLHSRLRARRGPASAFACADCRAPADDWAYDHADPHELVDNVGGYALPYSLNLDHYQPRCKRCHAAQDRRTRV